MTVQHLTQAYASEKVNLTIGGLVQSSQGLSGSRAVAILAYALSEHDRINVQAAVADSGNVLYEVGASRQVDPRTVIEAAIVKEDSEENLALKIGSRRQIDEKGSYVGADIKIAQPQATGFPVLDENMVNELLLVDGFVAITRKV